MLRFSHSGVGSTRKMECINITMDIPKNSANNICLDLPRDRSEGIIHIVINCINFCVGVSMEILYDPNIAYILLAGSLVFTIMAILHPGTGLLEVGALFALMAAGASIFGLASQDLINWWSFIIIIAGIVFFILSIKFPKRPVYLVISIILLIIGSLFLFRSEAWYIPSVHPFLAIIVSVLMGAFFWIMTSKVMETRAIIPVHDLRTLNGALGEAKSFIHKDGSVQVAGELWSARSETPIRSGDKVRVLGRDGFILLVEPIETVSDQE